MVSTVRPHSTTLFLFFLFTFFLPTYESLCFLLSFFLFPFFLSFLLYIGFCSSFFLESIDAVPRSSYRSLTRPDAAFGVRRADSPPPFFFIQANLRRLGQIHADSGQNGLIPAEMGIDTAIEICRYSWFWLIQPLKLADMAASDRNSHRNEQWLPFFCFMWPCEREKKKKREGRRRRWEDSKKWMEEE